MNFKIPASTFKFGGNKEVQGKQLCSSPVPATPVKRTPLGLQNSFRSKVPYQPAVFAQSQSERVTPTEGDGKRPSQPTATLRNDWMEFLEVLQSQGHFTSQRGEVLHVYTEVKWALLQFARARTDAVFALDRGHLKELAQAPLLPPKKGRTERKLANADARLKATYAPESLSYAHAPAQGEASMQDVLRVLWEWSAASPGDIEAHAPGLAATVRSLLKSVVEVAQAGPSPEHVALAQQLSASTPSTSQMGAMEEGKLAHRARQEERQAQQYKASTRGHNGYGVDNDRPQWRGPHGGRYPGRAGGVVRGRGRRGGPGSGEVMARKGRGGGGGRGRGGDSLGDEGTEETSLSQIESRNFSRGARGLGRWERRESTLQEEEKEG